MRYGRSVSRVTTSATYQGVRFNADVYRRIEAHLAEREREYVGDHPYVRGLNGLRTFETDEEVDHATREIIERPTRFFVPSIRRKGRTSRPSSGYDSFPEGKYEAVEVQIHGSRTSTTINMGETSHFIDVRIDGDDDYISLLFDFIEQLVAEYTVEAAPPPVPRVFIGHGGDQQWRILRDELRDSHHIAVEAYEGQPRAGQTIQNVLQSMMATSNFAVLVMSAAEETTDGRKLARANVIHEVGLFQAHHGWANAVVLLEDGVEEFSNLAGTQQIRFAHGNISGAVGRVVAEIRMRFPTR